jgi:colanic acid biosynthesis protein WcaH
MGWRGNDPARGTWFVPGGRIRKNEKIADAFERIIRTETGLVKSLARASSAAFTNTYIRRIAFRILASEPTIACWHMCCVLANDRR